MGSNNITQQSVADVLNNLTVFFLFYNSISFCPYGNMKTLSFIILHI